MILKQTDGAAMSPPWKPTCPDGTSKTTDAEGNITSTSYLPCCDAVTCIMDALGGTARYSL